MGRGPGGARGRRAPDREVGPLDREADRAPVFKPDVHELPAAAVANVAMHLDRASDERVEGMRDRYTLKLLARTGIMGAIPTN